MASFLVVLALLLARRKSSWTGFCVRSCGMRLRALFRSERHFRVAVNLVGMFALVGVSEADRRRPGSVA